MRVTPGLWVWIGSPGDKLDVLRYVSATTEDILGQEVVATLRAERDELREMVDHTCKSCLDDPRNAAVAEVRAERDKLRKRNEELRGVA